MIGIVSFIFTAIMAWAQISADFGNGGAIRIGESVTTCSSLIQGAVKFDSSDRTLKYCDASSWKLLVVDPCSTSLPSDWTFTDITGQSRSTVVSSSIHQISGIGTCAVPISVSGVGSTAEYQICDDASCSSVSQAWGSTAGSVTNTKYIQVRLTTSAYGNVAHKAHLTVGFRLETWSATTAGDCTDVSPAIGTFCTDGTVYVGLSPNGNVKMYTTPCNAGRYWDGTACAGTLALYTWSSYNTINNGVSNTVTGEANTTTLAGLSNADAPYGAASYCYNLNAHGQTDWYLPTTGETSVMQTACGTMPEANCADSGNRHWSSRESSAGNAFHFYYNGSTGASTKTAGYRLRCVRKD